MSINSSQQENDKLYTVHEVARRLRVDDGTVRRWVRFGTLPAVTLPHKGKRQCYRIRQADLDRVLSTPVQEQS